MLFLLVCVLHRGFIRNGYRNVPFLDDMYFELGISPYMCDDFGEEASSTGGAALSGLMMHDQRRCLV
jgi:hypothetical protein